MLVMLKNHMNYLKDRFLECFFKEYSRFLFFKNVIFLIKYNNESLSLEKENIKI